MSDGFWLLDDRRADVQACVSLRKRADGRPIVALGVRAITLVGEVETGCMGAFGGVDDAQESFRGAMLTRFNRAPSQEWKNEPGEPPAWFAAANFYLFATPLNVQIGVPLVETFMRAADAGVSIGEALAQTWEDNKPPAGAPKPAGDGHGPLQLSPGKSGPIVRVVEEKLGGQTRGRDHVMVLKAKWLGRPKSLDSIRSRMAASKRAGRG